MRKIRPSILLMLLSVLFYSCEKEYSLEGNHTVGGSAVFTFDGAPGNCTNALVTGNYVVGAALGASSVATVNVTVTTAGAYTVTTGAVNGITFSGAGSFTTTGTQTITLFASGIPVSPGTFSFTPGNAACSFSVTVSSGGGSSGGTAVYTLNGAPGNCTSFTPGGTFKAGTPLVTGNFANISVNVTTIGTYTISTNTINGITFSATGTFTATGNQLVQLTGTGTPIVAGAFTFRPGTNGCDFSITVTPAAGAAVFTYGGAPGNCTTATPAGTYTTGTALTAANTVTLGINVTTVGTYNISTPAVNGISFSGAGNFTTTGAQTVVLTGVGTPTTAGISNFVPSNNGCSFPVTIVAGNTPVDFLKCDIDGVPKTFNVNLVADLFDPNTFTIDGEESTAVTTASFGLQLTKPTGITTGAYNRYSVTNTSTYCLIGYLDGISATDVWISGVGPSTAGFVVTVTSLAGNRIQGTFSGTIYVDPVFATGAKVITNGQFSVAY